MHNPLQPVRPTPGEIRSDLLLWTGLLLSPLAMGVNTIVGFTVAHWTSDTGRKHLSYLVSAIDLVLCISAFAISMSLYSQYRDADENLPINGRRVFMAKVSMLLSVMAALVVVAGTLAVVTLHPWD